MAIAFTSKAETLALAGLRSSIASDKFMEETQWKQVEVQNQGLATPLDD